MTGEQFELEYCEDTVKRAENRSGATVALLVEHPFRDRRWILAKALPERGFYLLATAEGLTVVLHESEFSRIE